MSDEPLDDPVTITIAIPASNLQITSGDHKMTFNLDALTNDRQIVIPDSKSRTISFNTTNVSCSVLPTGDNNTLYGIGAGSDLITGDNNIVLGHNAQAGDANAQSRVVLGGTGQFDDCTHIDTTDVDIPNLPENAYDDVMYFDTLTGKLGHAPVASLDEWADGTAGAPGKRFASDTNTGLYRAAADTLGITTGGTLKASFTPSQVQVLDGTVSAPGLSFISDTNTGIYRVGADNLAFACGGVQALNIGTSFVNITSSNTWQTALNVNNTTSTRQYGILNGGSANNTFGHTDSVGVNTLGIYVAGTGANIMTQKWNENQCAVRVGSASLPSYSFYEDNNTGMYRSAADALSWSTNGTLRLTLSTTALTSTLPYYAPDGSHSAPAYTFSGDTDTGMYRSASNEITFNTGLATGQYPLRIGVADNMSAVRNHDVNAVSAMTNLQVYGNGFNTIIYRAYAQTPSVTAYQFMRFENNGGVAWRVRGDGATFADGAYSGAGADYAEWFESSDGKEIPIGSSVVLQDGKVRVAQLGEEEKILGVVRPKVNTNGCVVIGNSAEDDWVGKFLKDEFGEFIMEPVDYYKWVDEDGSHKGYYANQIPLGVVVPDNKEVVPSMMRKLNPAYDPEQVYTPRSERVEWHIIGMFGQIPVKNGQVLSQRWQLMKDINDGSVAKLYLVQ